MIQIILSIYIVDKNSYNEKSEVQWISVSLTALYEDK